MTFTSGLSTQGTVNNTQNNPAIARVDLCHESKKNDSVAKQSERHGGKVAR
jgi:hypothetical protein